jgi:hypothetical protein
VVSEPGGARVSLAAMRAYTSSLSGYQLSLHLAESPMSFLSVTSCVRDKERGGKTARYPINQRDDDLRRCDLE